VSFDSGVLALVIPLAFFGASIVAIYDTVLWSDAHWDGAGLRTLPWFLIMALLGPTGASLYWFRARPRLEKVDLRN